jgi:hypothetical protein
MTTRYWQFHVRPIYRHGRAWRFVATVSSTVGTRRARAYAMTLPHADRNAAARAGRELIEHIFELETDVLAVAQ